MTTKLPAFQFYPGDWRKDIAVQSLTYHDRGVWFEMLCLMHESERRGVLVLNGQPMSDDALARLLGLDKQILTTTLTNLIDTGVASREPDTGAIFNRRMVRDEYLRAIRAEAGKKGGNPLLLKQKGTMQDKQTETPSASISVSSSKEKASRAKRANADAADPRHEEFRRATAEYWNRRNADVMPWNWSEGKALKELLSASPGMTIDRFQELLANRDRSEGVNHADPPRMWLRNVVRYGNGPLNQYGQPLGGGSGVTNGNGNRAKQRTDGNFAALAKVAGEEGVDLGATHTLGRGASGGDYSGDIETLRLPPGRLSA